MLLAAVGCSELRGPARVVDGDSLVVGGQAVRLHGIDAPELGQTCERDGAAWPCGRAAREALQGIVAAGHVQCRVNDVDRYRRAIARCTVAGRDAGALMVRRGLAVAYTRYSMDYLALENEARMAGRGIWAGRFVQPERWRRRQKK